MDTCPGQGVDVKYIIGGPDYRFNSAGIMALYRLCHNMRRAGYDAYVLGTGNPEWDNPRHGKKIADDDIAIYPEVMHDNPLNAKRVIRWMLYYPTAYWGGRRIPMNEMCVPYAKFTVPEINQYCDYPVSVDDCLNIPITDPDLFFINPSIPKTKTVYYIGKGGGKFDGFKLPDGAIQVCPPVTPTRAATAKLLQESKLLYCFDYNSAVMIDAYMCGCEILIITESGRAIEWWGESRESLIYRWSNPQYIHDFIKRVESFRGWL